MKAPFPRSQGELIRAARGPRTQKEFALVLDVDRTSLSRYESEKLGAPTAVINFCLQAVADAQGAGATRAHLAKALEHARMAVGELERVAPSSNE
jgi:hypothetical protein